VTWTPTSFCDLAHFDPTGDLALHEWSNGSSSSLAEAVQQPGTWLLYPRDDAVDAASVDWSTVSQIVLIDSQWSKASAVGSDPCLAALPAMRLTNGPRTCFWRVATRRLDGVEGLLSTAECVRHTLGVRAAALRLGKSEVYQDGDRLDDLLLLFALQLRAVASESKNCCPWCTDADRRLRVDAGAIFFFTQHQSLLPVEAQTCGWTGSVSLSPTVQRRAPQVCLVAFSIACAVAGARYGGSEEGTPIILYVIFLIILLVLQIWECFQFCERLFFSCTHWNILGS